MGNLYVTRHAEKLKTDGGLFSDANPPLSQKGEIQAIGFVRRFSGVVLDTIIHGTDIRHEKTALHLRSDRGFGRNPDERLNEWYDESLKGFDYSKIGSIAEAINALFEDSRYRGPLEHAREEAEGFLTGLEDANVAVITSQIKGAIMMQAMIGSPLGSNDGEFIQLMLHSAEVYHFTKAGEIYTPIRRIEDPNPILS